MSKKPVPDRTETDVSSTSTNDDEASDSVVRHMTKFMKETKLEDGKSFWASTLETMGMLDGKKKKDDILCETFEEAMNVFAELVKEKDWQFASTPFEGFQATKEDLFKAFVHWSRKSEDDATYYNPSKGFRRLEEYVKWMDKNCKDMEYKVSTIKAVHESWKSKIVHDKEGRLVWWIDVGKLDFKFIKTIPSDDTLCYFVWFCHLVLFDKLSQENGFLIVESMGFAGMIESMTVVSADIKHKLDRLTIGVLPVKMEAAIIFNCSAWLRIIVALMAPFLGKKMKKRMIILPNDTNYQAYFDDKLGRENIPVGIAQLDGRVASDIVEQTLDRLMGIGEITDEVET